MTRNGAVSAAFVKELIALRSERDRISSAFRFADPAWDLLLDLTAARLEGRTVGVAGAGMAPNVPGTTAVRWLDKLVQDGLIERSAESGDGRGGTLRTSDETHERMLGHLSDSVEKLARLFQKQEGIA